MACFPSRSSWPHRYALEAIRVVLAHPARLPGSLVSEHIRTSHETIFEIAITTVGTVLMVSFSDTLRDVALNVFVRRDLPIVASVAWRDSPSSSTQTGLSCCECYE
jgi:hypothetical protein